MIKDLINLLPQAPKEIPSWFEPEMRQKPDIRLSSETFRDKLEYWKAQNPIAFDGSAQNPEEGWHYHSHSIGWIPSEFQEEIAAWDASQVERIEALKKWEIEYDFQKEIQWKAYWAMKQYDALLKWGNEDGWTAETYKEHLRTRGE